MPQTPNLFLSVGKPVKDEYGRTIGKIASFALTPSGKFDAVFVEKGDGKFTKESTEHLRFEGPDVVIISGLKSGASTYCDQIPLLWRKDQALKELADKKKISKEVYDELHRSFEGALTQLKSEAQGLGSEIEKEIAMCAEEIKQLNYALVHLEIEHEIGKIDDQAYATAFSIVQDNLKQINTEKGDLEILKSKLSNILLGDNLESSKNEKTKKPLPTPTSPELPEPPVVVYVKEVGRTGI